LSEIRTLDSFAKGAVTLKYPCVPNLTWALAGLVSENMSERKELSTQGAQEAAPSPIFEYLKAEEDAATLVLNSLAVDIREALVNANAKDENKVMDAFVLGALAEDNELIRDIVTYARVYKVGIPSGRKKDLEDDLLNAINELAKVYNSLRGGDGNEDFWTELVNIHGDLLSFLTLFIRDLMEEIEILRHKDQGNA